MAGPLAEDIERRQVVEAPDALKVNIACASRGYWEEVVVMLFVVASILTLELDIAGKWRLNKIEDGENLNSREVVSSCWCAVGCQASKWSCFLLTIKYMWICISSLCRYPRYTIVHRMRI